MPYAFCEQIGKEIRDISDEVPFEIPEGWEWVRLGTITQLISDGTHKTPLYVGNGIPFLSVQNISKGYFDLTKIKYITEDEHKKLIERVKPLKNDILICRIGTLGKAIKINVDFEFSIFVSLGLIRLIDIKIIDFIIFAINSPLGLKWIDENKVGGGTHTYKINLVDLPNMLIPIPPIEEQHRIVAKIEELLPYIEQYEKAETQLTVLNETFPEMLKKSILQEAVQGKLVPQDPNDEPASVLLERIKAEKQRLVKEGKIKKDKHGDNEITFDKIPYEIPQSWVWCRIGSIFTLQAGKNINANQITENYSEGLFPCFGGNGKRGYVSMYNREGNYPIIGRQGALCGNINLAHGKFYATEHAVCVETYANIDILWCCYFLMALNMNQYATATAQPGLAVKNINEVYIPLPPLAEQKRIVAKIEELMQYCDKL